MKSNKVEKCYIVTVAGVGRGSHLHVEVLAVGSLIYFVREAGCARGQSARVVLRQPSQLGVLDQRRRAMQGSFGVRDLQHGLVKAGQTVPAILS